MRDSTRGRARKREIEILEKEILELKGRKREAAMKTYRRLQFPLADEAIYFIDHSRGRRLTPSGGTTYTLYALLEKHTCCKALQARPHQGFCRLR